MCDIYRMKEGILQDEQGIARKVYGIEAVDEAGNILFSFPDIFFDLEKAKAFVHMCNDQQVELVHILDDEMDMFQLFGTQVFEIADDLLQYHGMLHAIVKEFGRCNAQILADIEESAHGWKRSSVFDFVDIRFGLAHAQTHISSRNAFLCAKLRQPFGK